MDVNVKEFLQKKQEEETAALTQEKEKLLKRLGLFNEVVVDKDAGYNRYDFDHENGKYIFYKYVYPEITDEEYKKLLKYDKPTEVEPESNGEMGLFVIASIELACCVLAGVICLFMSVDAREGGMLALGGVSLVLIGLIQFWLVKVFTNISRKATAIYKLLKEKE